jgi:hypothetical protein
MTVCAQYGISPAGHVRLRSALASYHSPNGYSLPRFTVTLADGATGIADDRLSGPLDQGNGARSYETKFTAFRGTLSAPQTLVVTLMAFAVWRAGAKPSVAAPNPPELLGQLSLIPRGTRQKR